LIYHHHPAFPKVIQGRRGDQKKLKSLRKIDEGPINVAPSDGGQKKQKKLIIKRDERPAGNTNGFL
jgi:hypothetical protein